MKSPEGSPRRSVLRRGPFVALLVSQTVSGIGSQLTFLALPWFVLETSGSATKMGIVFAAELLPLALLGILSGQVVTRLGARTTMVVGDFARVPIVAAIPLFHHAGLLSFPLLLVLAAALGAFLAPYFASQRLVLPEVLGEDEVAVGQANAIVEGMQRLTSLLGPALAGLLIAVLGEADVLLLDAATFLFSGVVLAAFVPRSPVHAGSEQAGGLLAGLSFIRASPLLRVLAPTALVLNGIGTMLTAGVIVLARDEYNSPKVAGSFFAAFGIGAVVGMFFAIRLLPRVRPIRLAAGAFVGMTLPVFALAFDLPIAGVMAAVGVSGVFQPMINAPLITLITVTTPEALRAKVTTAIITLALLAGPLGYVLSGPLLEAWGPRRVFLLVAVSQFTGAAWFAIRAWKIDAELDNEVRDSGSEAGLVDQAPAPVEDL